MIGIHVLANQRQLAYTGPGQPFDLFDDLFNWPRDFSAARIGHHTESTELVAAFLHSDEGGNATLRNGVSFGCRQNIEFVLDRKFGVDDFLSALRAGDHLRQAVIILRADDQIDSAGAANNFFALRLRDTAGDREQYTAAIARRRFPSFADSARLRIEL